MAIDSVGHHSLTEQHRPTIYNKNILISDKPIEINEKSDHFEESSSAHIISVLMLVLLAIIVILAINLEEVRQSRKKQPRLWGNYWEKEQ